MICDKEPYFGLKVFGPYTRKDNRQVVILQDLNTLKLKTVSFSKFILEIFLGRILDPNKETVDHIDKDFTNNSLANLRIIKREKHAYEDSIKLDYEELNCILCGNLVPKERLKGRHRNKLKKKVGPFCSRSCAGYYGTLIQKGFPPMINESKEVKTTVINNLKNVKKEQQFFLNKKEN